MVCGTYVFYRKNKTYINVENSSFFFFTDINECNNNNGGCLLDCDNSDGSFQCSCRPGFRLNSDGRTCNG